MRFHKLLPAFLLLILVTGIGCVSTHNFSHLPVDPSDFKKPYSELIQAYPEITTYEDGSRFPKNTPLAKDLVTAWGEPDGIKTDWFYYFPGIGVAVVMGSVLDLGVDSIATVIVGVTALLPGPPKTYTWIKGDYCIDAQTHVTITSFYRRSIIAWKWANIKDTEKLSKECQATIFSKQDKADNKPAQTKAE